MREDARLMSSSASHVSASRFPLIAAPFTAFDAAGEVDLEVIAEQAAKLRRDGVAGAFVCGTTGEGMSLTLEERLAVASAWCEVREGLEVFVHVGAGSVRDAERLAAHAGTIDCQAIAALGPTFFTPSSPEALVAYFERIAAATARPFYYYHIPSMMRVPYRASELLPMLAARIPTFAGIKYTHNDLEDFRRCVEMADGKYRMLFGRDEMLLSGIDAGANGAVGSTYNYAAAIYQRVWEALQAGDRTSAQEWQDKATRFIAIFVKYGGMEGNKALMAMCGVDCGAPRLPLAPLSADTRERMRTELEACGFFESVRQQ